MDNNLRVAPRPIPRQAPGERDPLCKKYSSQLDAYQEIHPNPHIRWHNESLQWDDLNAKTIDKQKVPTFAPLPSVLGDRDTTTLDLSTVDTTGLVWMMQATLQYRSSQPALTENFLTTPCTVNC
ncbi:hypothetical protein F25303_5111 [Fusarium sp. NRRL 25303]|nr:hypothetical protein F25303_5111 [Fusarium sp. NRRL 25303]